MPIEQHTPALERIVSHTQEVEELASGFGGDMGPAEGPVWWHEGGYLLFSDISNNRRMKWTPGAGATVTNIAWGDNDWRTLYITTRQFLARIRLQLPGIPVPRGTL